MAVQITSVIKSSLADKNKIKANDILLTINGNEINDVLDYMFYVAEDCVKLGISRDEKKFTVKIKKSEYDDIGLEFSSFLMDKKQSCKNKCVFCFIDQMPKGMRETLYFKDDDERLSFLHGNYVTLTNLEDKDIQRVINMRLNINISVHTTNPELRVKMMLNRFAGEKLKYLKQLADASIMMNCQIVLCPNLNDGDELKRTLSDLKSLMPSVQSVAVVPVGLTKFRDGLYPLSCFNKTTANNAIDIIEEFQKSVLEEFGTRLVFPADEFYLLAERDIPQDEFYEDYPQYENGVGIIRSLKTEFSDALKDNDFVLEKTRKISFATGTLAFDLMNELITKAKNKWNNLDCNVYAIKNDFFGESITVAGLVTGQDLINQLKDKNLGDTLIIPSVMLMNNSEIFLDDITVTDVEKQLGVKIISVSNNGYELLEKLLGIIN